MPEITPLPMSMEPTGTVIPQTTQPSIVTKLKAALTPPAEETAPQTTPQAGTEAPKEPAITAETSPQESVRIAALIRKEKQLLKRARELTERENKIKEVQSQYKPWQEASELATQNKLEAIKKLGITYDDLTAQMLNGGNLPPEALAEQKAILVAKQEIEAFKKQQEAAQQALQQTQYQNAIKQIEAEVQSIVDSGDKYPLVKTANAYNDVSKYIEDQYHQTNRIIPIEEAIEKVEAEIAEGILQFAKIDKIKAKLLELEAPKAEEPPPQQNPKITTLTHKTVASPSVSKPLTYAEKRQRAIDAFYGKL